MGSYNYRNYTVFVHDSAWHVNEIGESYPTEDEAHAAIDERIREVHVDEGRSSMFHRILWKMGFRETMRKPKP